MKYVIHDATVDFERKRLCRTEIEIEMEPRVADVLRYFVEHAGRVVSREELLDAVWHTSNISDDVLTRCVNLIRKAFEDDAARPRVLETITKRGYRLIATVKPIDETATARTSLMKPRFEERLLGGRITLTLLDSAETRGRMSAAAEAALGISHKVSESGETLRLQSRTYDVIVRSAGSDLVVEIGRWDKMMAAPIVAALLGFLLAASAVLGKGFQTTSALGIGLAVTVVGWCIGWFIRHTAAASLERRLREDLNVLLTAARIQS